jgi:GNAT superfamily N-acetyltransferase
MRRDRNALTIRRTEPADEAAVRGFLEALSVDSRWKRYHNAVPRVMPWMIDPVVRPDHVTHEALVACRGDTIVAIAEWGRTAPDATTADMAVVVSEGCRRHGIARALIRRLARNARAQGIESFSGSILSVNRASMALLFDLGRNVSTKLDGGTVEFSVPLRMPA